MDTNEKKNSQPASQLQSVGGEIVLFNSQDGKVQLDVRLKDETVWLTQQQIAELYGKSTSTINEHIQNIFEDGEQSPEVCVKKFGNSEFQQKAPFFYNLDIILSVGYRVRSKNGVLFRQWATSTLTSYIVKGFAIDSDRLKGNGGGQY